MPASLLLSLQVLWKRRALEKSCRWTPGQLAGHQRAQLAAIRGFAAARSPFYARFHRGLEAKPLDALPILSKTTLMENFDDLVTDRSIRLADVEAFIRQDPGDGLFRGRYVALSTSGSTGQRGVFVFDKPEWIECLAAISRPMKWANVEPRPFRKIRSTMLASTTPWHYSARVGRSLSSSLLPTLRLDAGEAVESMVARLNAWQPEVLVAYPSVLRQLAGEQMAGRLGIAPRVCATSAEVLTAETRRRVQEAFGVRIFETYGATEYAPIAAECPAGRRHLFEDGAIVEVVDERGNAVPPGRQGERVLLTVFGRRVQPLIRYEISDMVRVSAVMCDCGRPFRCIDAIEGRQEDVLYFASRGGRGSTVAIHPNVFHRVMETVSASGWQVIQLDPDEAALLVNLTGAPEEASLRGIENSLRDALAAEGVETTLISAHRVGELSRGKTGKAPLIVAATQRKESKAAEARAGGAQ